MRPPVSAISLRLLITALNTQQQCIGGARSQVSRTDFRLLGQKAGQIILTSIDFFSGQQESGVGRRVWPSGRNLYYYINIYSNRCLYTGLSTSRRTRRRPRLQVATGCGGRERPDRGGRPRRRIRSRIRPQLSCRAASLLPAGPGGHGCGPDKARRWP